MSGAGTRIMAKGLVDEGMEFERMERELQTLKNTIAMSVPVCPHCMTQMKPVNFAGYYDSFSFWECKCEHFENGEKQHGQYA